MTTERWNAAKFIKHQPGNVVDNSYNATEPLEPDVTSISHEDFVKMVRPSLDYSSDTGTPAMLQSGVFIVFTKDSVYCRPFFEAMRSASHWAPTPSWSLPQLRQHLPATPPRAASAAASSSNLAPGSAPASVISNPDFDLLGDEMAVADDDSEVDHINLGGSLFQEEREAAVLVDSLLWASCPSQCPASTRPAYGFTVLS